MGMAYPLWVIRMHKKRANHLKSDLLSSVAGVGPEPTTSGL